MKSVYKIPQKIKGLSDERKRKSIPLFNIVMPVLIFLMLQYESFHTIFSAPESMEKRLKNCIRGKIPKVDAVRDLLSRIDPKEIEEIHAQTIDVLKRNRIFREGTIGGYVAAGINGMELFSSTSYGTQFRISYSHRLALSTDYNECTLRTLFDKADKYMYENKQQSKQGRQD